jgi:hypothetical protein
MSSGHPPVTEQYTLQQKSAGGFYGCRRFHGDAVTSLRFALLQRVGVAGIVGSLRLRLIVHPQLEAVEQTTTLGAVVFVGFAEEFTVSAALFSFAEAILKQELRGFVVTHHELCYLSFVLCPPAEIGGGGLSSI